jgi:hypothetical protein
VWLYSNIGLAQMDEGRNKENGVRVQIADPDLVVKKETLERKGWTGIPKPLLKKSSKTTISPARGSR